MQNGKRKKKKHKKWILPATVCDKDRHVEIWKSKENSGLREEQGDLRRIWALHRKRGKAEENNRRMRRWPGGVSHSPAACSGNSLEPKGRMVVAEQPEEVLHPNSSRLLYELFRLHCLHKLWKTKNNNFKAGLKGDWMSTLGKGCRDDEL